MDKLIDEVGARITTALTGPGVVYIPMAVRTVLNEMFEEREVKHQPDMGCNAESWWIPSPLVDDTKRVKVDRQTILVPRAKPEPTLAEVAKNVVRDYRACVIYPACQSLEDLVAALAREEGK